VDRAEAWPWSSVRAHLAGEDDALVEVAPLLDRYGDFAALLGGEDDQQASRALRTAQTTGRPVGSADWLALIEQRSGRKLTPGKRGPKARPQAEAVQFGHRECWRAIWSLSP